MKKRIQDSRMRLVRVISESETNTKTKKKYNKFFIFMCDESVFEYELNEWKVVRGEEWVEVEKIDKSEMDCFSIGNILRVRFVCVDNKGIMTDVIPLKPVPPTAA